MERRAFEALHVAGLGGGGRFQEGVAEAVEFAAGFGRWAR
jgi:hypothetical protein